MHTQTIIVNKIKISLFLGVPLRAESDSNLRPPLCKREERVFYRLYSIYIRYLSTGYPYIGDSLSTESIDSMGLLWRCKWLQMADETRMPLALSKGGISHMTCCVEIAIPPCKGL